MFIFLIGIFVSAGLSPAYAQVGTTPKVDVPRGWKKIELRDFSLEIPPGMKKRDVRGIDSEVWEYRSRDLRLAIDYGMYSNDLESYADRPEYKAEWISIDGKEAKVATYRSGKDYVAAVYFPGLWGSDTKLGFSVESKSATGQELSKKIFQSIRFRR
jgi:hypothetical protein